MMAAASATPASRNDSYKSGLRPRNVAPQRCTRAPIAASGSHKTTTRRPGVDASSSHTRNARSSPPTTIMRREGMTELSAQLHKLRPHPLADELIARLRSAPHAAVLEVGCGAGRNTRALVAAGFRVAAIPDRRVGEAELPRAVPFDAALSTHALLHGTHRSLRVLLSAIGSALQKEAPFYATFGNVSDRRHGRGNAIEEDVYVEDAGDEPGVPHIFFSEADLREVLSPDFTIESLEERSVDTTVGRWAHSAPEGSVHWFLRARRR